MPISVNHKHFSLHPTRRRWEIRIQGPEQFQYLDEELVLHLVGEQSHVEGAVWCVEFLTGCGQLFHFTN